MSVYTYGIVSKEEKSLVEEKKVYINRKKEFEGKIDRKKEFIKQIENNELTLSKLHTEYRLRGSEDSRRFSWRSLNSQKSKNNYQIGKRSYSTTSLDNKNKSGKESIATEIQSVKVDIDESSKKIDIITNDVINKSSIFSFDFDLQKFLDSLRKEELLAFSGLLLNSLVLSYVVSIILVLYGDYLIKRFDLENKYPKLAKFIQLRRKLQNYYLKVFFYGYL